MKELEEHTHPSYGLLRFSRINGNSGTLFGTDVQSNNYIEMTLSEAIVNRNLSRDWYHDRKKIIKVKMSAIQFSELITSMNIGSGVPVTISFVNNTAIVPEENKESRKSYTHRKFKERMLEFAKEIAEQKIEAEELIAKKTLSKTDQQNLNWMLTKITQELTSNIPFFMECFQEVMDKVVVEAKSEIDSALIHTITSYGKKALGISTTGDDANNLISNDKI